MSGPAYTLDIRDGATPELARIIAWFEPGRLNRAVGKSATQRIQQHLEALDKVGNALGGARTHYYSDQAGDTKWYELNGGVLIGVGQPNKGLSLHYTGGDLGPENLRNAKMFAVPARAEAHGKVPGDFDNLVMLFGRNGPYALASAEDFEHTATKGKHKGELVATPAASQTHGAGGVLFWLTTHLHFEPNPDVLPTDQEVQIAVVGALYDLWQSTGGRN